MSTMKISTPRSLLIGDPDPTSVYECQSISSQHSDTPSSVEELKQKITTDKNEKRLQDKSRSWSPPSPCWSRRDSMLALTELSTFQVSFIYPGTMKYQDMRKKLLTISDRISVFLSYSCSSLWAGSTGSKFNQNHWGLKILWWRKLILSKICLFSMHYTKVSTKWNFALAPDAHSVNINKEYFICFAIILFLSFLFFFRNKTASNHSEFKCKHTKRQTILQ